VRLTASVPSSNALLWGIVAVEPESGATFYRRLELAAPP